MKKDHKVFVADIDRTLRDGSPDIGPLTRSAMNELHRRGVLMGIASGRPLWQRLLTHAQEWGLDFQFDFLIGLNGGEILDTRKNEKKLLNPLDEETIRDIILKMEHTGTNPFVYRDEGYMLALRMDALLEASAKRNKNEARVVKDISELWAEPTGKIMYRTETQKEMDEEVIPYARTLENNHIFCFKTAVNLLEFQDRKNNKGNALIEYCKDNGIDMEDVIAFGDAENDLEMMRAAGYSVCLCNGMKENKEIADAVSEYPAGDDGVGHWLYDHYL